MSQGKIVNTVDEFYTFNFPTGVNYVVLKDKVRGWICGSWVPCLLHKRGHHSADALHSRKCQAALVACL